LLIGVRRFLAAREAGLESIPALVLDEALKPDEAIEARLIENLQREDLDPLDEADAY
jgi:ParB family chromosome partitioning protein